MVKFKLLEQMDTLAARTGKRPDLKDVAKATGVHRTTLYRLGRVEGYNTTTDAVEKLCRYFGCELSDFMELVPSPSGDEHLAQELGGQKSPKNSARPNSRAQAWHRLGTEESRKPRKKR